MSIAPAHALSLVSGARVSLNMRKLSWRKVRDSNSRGACAPAGFQDRCLQPLGQPSVSEIQRIAGSAFYHPLFRRSASQERRARRRVHVRCRRTGPGKGNNRNPDACERKGHCLGRIPAVRRQGQKSAEGRGELSARSGESAQKEARGEPAVLRLAPKPPVSAFLCPATLLAARGPGAVWSFCCRPGASAALPLSATFRSKYSSTEMPSALADAASTSSCVEGLIPSR